MQRRLFVIAGPDKGQSFPLQVGQTIVIGRGRDSDTQLNDPSISRVHCQVQVDSEQTLLVDRTSSGGTFMDDERVTQRTLRSGLVFTIGDTKIRYEVETPREEATIVRNAPPVKPPAASVTRLEDLVGQELGDYRIGKIIHRGSTGILFHAKDEEKNRVAAVKVLSPQFTSTEEERSRFIRAMKTMLNFHHDNVIELYNAGKKGPFCWAAMEYVEGESIIEIIRLIGVQGALDWREAYRVAVHVGRALSAAHERKIIHRNVTPTNIMRRSKDRAVMLGDLMLAKALEGTMAQQVTQPGQIIGDAPYLSPECTRTDMESDGRSDIYSLGATVYALLTGRPPFESDSLAALIQMIRQETPKPPKEFQMSTHDMFQDVVMQMLEKRPEDRYQSSAKLLMDLERVGKYANVEADLDNWTR